MRSGVRLVLATLVACAWHNSAMVMFEVTRDPTAFDWLPLLLQQLQVSVLLIAPGMLAAWLASRAGPATLRGSIATAGAFFLGSALGHWIVFRLIPVYSGTDIARTASSSASSLLTCTLIAGSVLGAMYWWRRDAVIRQEVHRTRMSLLAMRADRADAEMLRLRAQIEPHFMFNTMATIVQMYQTADRAAAGRTLARLIDYLGAARAHMRRTEAVLGDELALTEGYLEIQRLRMGARLRYQIDATPESTGSRLPPAALLTLVENAVKHGLSPRPGGGRLRVTAHRDGVWLALSVSDDGVGFRTSSGRGLGLANLRARMLGLYGPEATLRLSGAPEGGVMATMRLPFGAPPAEALT